jgi:hypothetical protein
MTSPQPSIRLDDLVSLKSQVEEELATQEDTKDHLFRKKLREYFETRLGGRVDRTLQDRLQLLLFVLRFFKQKQALSIQACIDAIKTAKGPLYDKFSRPGDSDAEWDRNIRFAVMRAVGLWVGMPSFFEDSTQSFIPILLGYKPGPATAIHAPLPDLLSKNRLVPSRSSARRALEPGFRQGRPQRPHPDLLHQRHHRLDRQSVRAPLRRRNGVVQSAPPLQPALALALRPPP